MKVGVKLWKDSLKLIESGKPLEAAPGVGEEPHAV